MSEPQDHVDEILAQWRRERPDLNVDPHALNESDKEAAQDLFEDMVQSLSDFDELVNDIMEMYPPGELPPGDRLSQRSPEEIAALLKGPLVPGGKHLYTVAYPP